MDTDFYVERVARFRIVRRDRNLAVPGSRIRAEYIINGLDPDDSWSLIWSFDDEDAAQECLQKEIDQEVEICKKFNMDSMYEYRLVDAGQATEIKRPIW